MALLQQEPLRLVVELGHQLKPKLQLELVPFVQHSVIALQLLHQLMDQPPQFEQQLHQLVLPQQPVVQVQQSVLLQSEQQLDRLGHPPQELGRQLQHQHFEFLVQFKPLLSKLNLKIDSVS